MGSITVSDSVNVSIVIDGQDKARLMWSVLDYALNNMTSLSADDVTLMNSVRTQLASVFD